MSKPCLIEPCVGVLCWKDDQLLLIKRANAPHLGHWSIPGGRIKFGESLKAAAARELMEETNIVADIGDVIGTYEFIGEDYHYIVMDLSADWREGEAQAGTDASEAAFFTIDEALQRVQSEDLKRLIEKHFAMLIV